MRATAICLLALLAFVANARDLEQTTDTACLTESVSTLVLAGTGSGRAQAVSFCQAEADARSAIEEIISEYIISVFEDSGNACTEVAASEAATGMAQAVASAYTSVTTTVAIEGTGEACASGFAGGDAFAVAVVDIIVELSVRLIEDNFPDTTYGEDVENAVDTKNNEATGKSIGNAVAVIISDAWAAATDFACTDGGFETNFEEAFVESTTTAIAQLWATVVVELCSKFDDADNDGLAAWEERTSMSVSDIFGEINVDTNVVAMNTEGGITEGTSAEVVPCDGSKKTRCCDLAAAKERETCSCGRGCTLRELVSSEGTVGTKIWVDTATDEKCFCPP